MTAVTSGLCIFSRLGDRVLMESRRWKVTRTRAARLHAPNPGVAEDHQPHSGNVSRMESASANSKPSPLVRTCGGGAHGQPTGRERKMFLTASSSACKECRTARSRARPNREKGSGHHRGPAAAQMINTICETRNGKRKDRGYGHQPQRTEGPMPRQATSCGGGRGHESECPG